jgi:hypothetical protein
MMSEATHDMTDDEKAIMEENKEDLNTKAVAGNEDCLHLAVFTPRVIYIIIWLSLYVLFVKSLSPPKPAGLGNARILSNSIPRI